MERDIWSAAFIAALVTTSLSSANCAQNKFKFIEPTLHSHCNDRPLTLPQDSETRARFQHFESVWKTRKEKNVVPLLVPFLSDPFPALRVRAVRALGELENPTAQPALQALLERIEAADKNHESRPVDIPLVTLSLALGRIASRGMKGKAKISTVLKRVGLTWETFVQLSKKVNGTQRFGSIDGEPAGDEIVNTVVDLLYAMGKRGENAQALAKELTLTPSQKVIVEVAGLPEDQEIQVVLDHLVNVYVVTSDDTLLSQHLARLGPKAVLALLQRLEDMKQNPKKYSGLEPDPSYPGAFLEHMGYVNLFDAAVKTQDPRMIPTLKYFEQNAQGRVRTKARMMREIIERAITK